MATQPMTKFVVNDPASTKQACLYLKNPTDEQLDAVMVWLESKKLDMVACLEGTAVFTKTGKGKPSPAIAIQFQSRIDFDAAAAKMAELYPCPKDLSGIQLTNHEVTDPVTDMPVAPIQELTPGDRALAQARQSINVGGPMPSVVASTSADDVPF